MSSFSKPGFASKAGKVAIGFAVLSALTLSACSAPAPVSNDGKSDPASSSSASASAAPQFDGFKSDAFDLSKQVSVSMADQTSVILLGNGAVAQKAADGKTSVVFTPYEDKDKAWTYDPSTPATLVTNLMRWKGKSYIVVLETVKESAPANGMQAAKDTTTENAVVLDATDGKVVNTVKGQPLESNQNYSDTDNYSLTNIIRKDATPQDTEFARPFMVGLVYSTFRGKVKLVDPLTGATVATDDLHGNGYAKPNNESDFITDIKSTDYVTGNERLMKGIFGNYALYDQYISSENTGGVSYDTFTLVNTVTGKVVSAPMKCAAAPSGLNSQKDAPVYSPDFRYVKFAGNYVFDTQTGKSFCDTPKENPQMRRFPVAALDNAGNMYGLAQRDYLRVNLADITKPNILLGNVSLTENQQPVLITDKGSAVFWLDNSHTQLVTVPSKG